MVSAASDAPIEEEERVIRSRVGQLLRRRREAAGLSRDVLAAACGMHKNSLRMYEAGARPIPITKLFLAARRLNVPVAALFDDDWPPPEVARALEVIRNSLPKD